MSRSLTSSVFIVCGAAALSACTSTRSYLEEVSYEATVRPGETLPPGGYGVTYHFIIPSMKVEWIGPVVLEAQSLEWAQHNAAITEAFQSAGLDIEAVPESENPRYFVIVQAFHHPYQHHIPRPVSSHTYGNLYNWQTGATTTASGMTTTYVPDKVELMHALLSVRVFDLDSFIEGEGNAPELWHATARRVAIYDAEALKEDLKVLLAHWGRNMPKETRSIDRREGREN